MMYTYYTLMRPPMPGAIPKAGLVEIEDFGERRTLPKSGREAWGAAVYCRPLTDAEIRQYELLDADLDSLPMNAGDIYEYAERHGAQAGIDLLLLTGLDAFDGTADEYEDVMKTLEESLNE